MKMRWLPIVLVLCLLTGGYAQTVTPRLHLVCRFTGQPMTPVLQTTAPAADKTASCCHVRVSPPASPLHDGPTFALAPGSCCVLHVSTTSGPLPLSPASPSFHAPLAQPSLFRLTVPQPYFAENVPVAVFAGRVAPPRAPPARSSLGRAPPIP